MMKQLDEDFRSNIRFFAFYLGNGTLIPQDADFDAIDYTLCAATQDDIIGQVFSVYLNTKQRYWQDEGRYSAWERAAQWLANYCTDVYAVVEPFQPWELEGVSQHQTVTDAIKTFTQALGNGSLMPALLADTDYVPELMEGGSFLEQIIAIYTNVLRIDDNQQVYNVEQATLRSAQYIRQYIDPNYVILPPLTTWEIELV